ncbi:MAG TPA: hypothetical protein VLR45_10005, partial [Desulfoprunum sp.]|nr:hypothetical protein [Desulfoprunum sp.]
IAGQYRNMYMNTWESFTFISKQGTLAEPVSSDRPSGPEFTAITRTHSDVGGVDCTAAERKK